VTIGSTCTLTFNGLVGRDTDFRDVVAKVWIGSLLLASLFECLKHR